jgi:hypothetical protein
LVARRAKPFDPARLAEFGVFKAGAYRQKFTIPFIGQ